MPAALTAALCATENMPRAVPPQLAKYAFQPGHKKIEGSGMLKGMKTAAVIYDKAAPALARKAVDIALNDRHREQGATLRQAIDKFLPDAGKASPLVETQTVIAIQTVHGLTQDHATLACINTSQRRVSVEPPPPSVSVETIDGGEQVSSRHERVEADG